MNPATKSVGFGGKRGEREGRELLRPKEREKEGGREAKGSREELEKQREKPWRGWGEARGQGLEEPCAPELPLSHSTVEAKAASNFALTNISPE